jgi:hypothetical protein
VNDDMDFDLNMHERKTNDKEKELNEKDYLITSLKLEIKLR